MRVFLDTKGDRVRVELAVGQVAKTFSNAKAAGDKAKDAPLVEIDVAKGGEVLELRVGNLAELMEELGLEAGKAI